MRHVRALVLLLTFVACSSTDDPAVENSTATGAGKAGVTTTSSSGASTTTTGGGSGGTGASGTGGASGASGTGGASGASGTGGASGASGTGGATGTSGGAGSSGGTGGGGPADSGLNEASVPPKADAGNVNDAGVRADASVTIPSMGVTCSGSSGGAVSPAPWEKLVGWGSVAGSGTNAVTGGGSASPVDATSMAQLQMLAAGTNPAVIRIVGKLSGEATLEGSNKTIIGAPGAEIQGLVTLKRAYNFILRNLTVVGDNCSDKPECKGGTDALSVTFASHHIWFDHCDVSDASDGNLDIKDGSDLITISWCKFHYTTPGREHRFSSLIGHSDSDTAAADDRGKLRVTFHHNWWADNVFERMPRVRFGQVHLFNNLYTSANNNYCVRAGIESDIRSEHNAYVGVNDPFDIEDPTGKLQSVDDLFVNIKGKTATAGAAFKPPYEYTMESACTVEASVRANAGPH